MANGLCHLCEPDQPIPTDQLLNHIRLMHPDALEPHEFGLSP